MGRHSTADVNSRCRDVRADVAGLEEAVLLTLKKQLEILLPVHKDGTKWNAFNQNFEEPNVLWFDTAWEGVPLLIQTLSEIFPDGMERKNGLRAFLAGRPQEPCQAVTESALEPAPSGLGTWNSQPLL